MVRPARYALVTMAVVVGAAATAAGCSSESPSTPASSTTMPAVPDATRPPGTTPGGGQAPSATTPGGAGIVRFEVPAQVACETGTRMAVPIRYETTGAAQVVFVVDGEQAPGRPELSGEYAANITCDGSAHTIVLTAIDAQGQTVVASKAVLTGPAG